MIKPLFTVAGDLESKGKIVYTEWNSFARTDVVEFSDIPGIKYIYTDGDVPTTMHYFSGDIRTIDESIKNNIFLIPFADLKKPESALHWSGWWT